MIKKFDIRRIDEISEFLTKHHSQNLNPIGEMIGGYEYTHDPLNYLYLKVMKRFEEYEEINSLDFDSLTFANELGLLILEKGVFIKFDNLFAIDSQRLLFKWLIHMREKFASNDEKFEGISKALNPNVSEFFNKELPIPMNFNIKDMKESMRCSLLLLVWTEFFENSHLFPAFASII